jgi:hypothetical protein
MARRQQLPEQDQARMPSSPAPVGAGIGRPKSGSAVEVTAERQQRQHAGALHRQRDLLLVTRAGALMRRGTILPRSVTKRVRRLSSL